MSNKYVAPHLVYVNRITGEIKCFPLGHPDLPYYESSEDWIHTASFEPAAFVVYLMTHSRRAGQDAIDRLRGPMRSTKPPKKSR